jgi:ubiquinone/menaquinone biosynthesis C-methylase UbiE
MKMTNRWNRFIYRLWAPIYDQTVNRLFIAGRRQAFEVVDVQPGESILLVGVGTGADLPLLPQAVWAVGLDLSLDMLARARTKLPGLHRDVTLVRGDAQAVPLKEASFDVVVLNLILSVVPDARACMQSALRALKPGGRIMIFDKFLPNQGQLTVRRRVLNTFSTVLGTDINRRLSDIVTGSLLAIVRDEPSIMGGMYRVILLTKGTFDDRHSLEVG